MYTYTFLHMTWVNNIAMSYSMMRTKKRTQLTVQTCSPGIVSRSLVLNKSTGLLCTTSIAVMKPFAEKLNDANPAPETLFTVNGVPVVVGGVLGLGLGLGFRV